MYVCMQVYTHVYMQHGWMDGLMDGWMDGRKHACILTYEEMKNITNDYKSKYIQKYTNKQTRPVNEYMY